MSGVTSRPDPAPRIRSALAPYASDIAAAAEKADDLAVADSLAVLAALARGERPPADAAARVMQRAEADSNA